MRGQRLGIFILWNYIQRDVSRCRIKNWKERSNKRAAWEHSVKEAKVCIGL
jgi:hypothetical protein